LSRRKDATLSSSAWQEIRALRAKPPGLAESDENRRETVAAALRQAEELSEAGAVAGYAAKPLPLFYSLSQAGRAISAAHRGDGWKLRGHGLKVAEATTADCLDTTVEPSGSDNSSYSGVTDAIGSPMLAGTAKLSQLWGANPDLIEVPLPRSVGDQIRPIRVPLGVQSTIGLPFGQTDPDVQQTSTGGFITLSVEVDGETAGEIANYLGSYPTLTDATVFKQGPSGTEPADPADRIERQNWDGRESINVGFEAPAEISMTEYWRRQRSLVSFTEIDHSQPLVPAPHLMGFALPEVAGGPAPLPVMLWWGLLLGLSSLARYEPAAWSSSLDLDASEAAVALERALDVAEERVPIRILEALRQGEASAALPQVS
jgi:hypothetical protein